VNITHWSGHPLTEPGIYRGVPLARYHTDWTAEPSISSSGLRTIWSASPAHYWDQSFYNPDREDRPDTEAMILGRAAHHLLLGEADFRREYAIRPTTYPDDKGAEKPWSGNSNWCKAWLAARAAEGLTVVTEAQVEKIKRMAAALATHPMVRAGALNGHIEHSFLWRDHETGVLLRARPDALPIDCLDFGDLKCTADVSDEGIERAIGGFGYHMQAALTRQACRALLGRDLTSFTLICVETTRPHCVRAKTIRPSDMDLADRQIRVALRSFAKGIRTGRWPGPGGEQTDAEYASITPWDERKINDRLALAEQETEAA
jgi:hypothetical protein